MEARARGLIPLLAPQCHVEITDQEIRAKATADVTAQDGVCYNLDWSAQRPVHSIPAGDPVRPDGDAVLRAQWVEFVQVVPGRGVVCLTRDRIMTVWLELLTWTTSGGSPAVRMRPILYSDADVPDQNAIRVLISSVMSECELGYLTHMRNGSLTEPAVLT